jgi:uncharacterized DUF497 family protein
MAMKDLGFAIERSDAQVIRDDPSHPRGNRQKVWAHDLSEDEVESVRLDDNFEATANRSFPEHCLVLGYTSTDRFIAVAFEILDEDMPIIRPITAFEPSED